MLRNLSGKVQKQLKELLLLLTQHEATTSSGRPDQDQGVSQPPTISMSTAQQHLTIKATINMTFKAPDTTGRHLVTLQ